MTETSEIVLSAVKDERGQSFTDIKEKTGLSNGVLQYHIRKNDKIFKEKGAIHYKGCCETCRFQEKCKDKDKCIQKELRKKRTKQILEALRNGKSQADIARDLDLTRATVNYHVDKLREIEIV
jgi:predicted transcriptional regulator